MNKNLIGKKYHNWEILEYIPKEKNKEQYVLCKCLCGTIRKNILRGIVKGKSKSCGCYRQGVGKPEITNQMIVDKYNTTKSLKDTARFFKKGDTYISEVLKHEGVKLYVSLRKDPVKDLITKICIKCGKEKPANDFYVRKDSNDGRRNDCIECHVGDKKLYNKENSEPRKKYMKQYRIDNPNYMKEWQQSNPDKYYGGVRRWRIENPEKVKIHKYDNVKRRLSKDPKYKLKHNIRRLILSSFTNKGYSKKSHTNKILGIDYEGFYRHIENQFVNGMSWENKGLWELDHKVPLSLGKTEEDIFKLNHYTNLQPLWRKDNQNKSNKILPEFEHLVEEYLGDIRVPPNPNSLRSV
jgi:hypothetical protein